MTTIHQISLAFAKLLSTDLKTVAVHLKDPSEFLDDGDKGVSLWLYQVQPDEFSRNAPAPVVEETPSAMRRTRGSVSPLKINLQYLVTPLTGSVQGDHDALGQMLLTIHEKPLLTVRNASLGLNEQVRISVLPDTLEDRVRLWESLNSKHYRLSFSCLLRTARLVSSETADESTVASLTAAGPLETEEH